MRSVPSASELSRHPSAPSDGETREQYSWWKLRSTRQRPQKSPPTAQSYRPTHFLTVEWTPVSAKIAAPRSNALIS